MDTQSRAVLGIDAAWTERNPSGIALIQAKNVRWKCIAVAPSYESFIAIAYGRPVNWVEKPTGGSPKFRNILAVAQKLLGGKKLDVIAVDMPLSTGPIMGRRVADQAVSKAFGHMGCGVHSPTMERPGKLSAIFTTELAAAGFQLATSTAETPALHQLIEVYPHPAIVRLLDENYRLPYKRGQIQSRLSCLVRIVGGLKKEIDKIDLKLPNEHSPGTIVGLKRFEDAIDALVCAWVGAQYLRGNALPYGDPAGAIWIPK